ncbi:MAG: T9SS type A sorting domain-containing protein [Bacteroidia bacterium]|nr:T9SS type A sorting domain-containing protein [Bacteroidia bacterium]
MKRILSITVFLFFTQIGLAQNTKAIKHAYIFSADSLQGFDEEAAKKSAISEGFLGEEFKIRMWGLKRVYINSKYGITPKVTKYKNSTYNNAKTSVAAVCVNEDFEASTAGIVITANQISGWSFSNGMNQFPNTSCSFTTTPGPVESELITTPASGYIDPVIGAVYPIFSVFGNTPNSGNSANPNIPNMKGSNFVRINSNLNNYSISKIEKTILVTPSNCLFQFAFITVFSSGHTCCDAGAMTINLVNATTNSPIACPSFSLSAPSSQCSAGPSAPAYYDCGTGAPISTNPSLVFNKWRISAVDLSAYIGQNITIEMSATDCTASGHYGYAYIDAQCSPMNIAFNNNQISAANPSVTYTSCGVPVFTITAPAGLGPYSWSGVGVPAQYTTPSFANQTFTTNFVGTYTLTMNPIGSCAPLTKTINLAFSPAPAPITITGNTLVCASFSTTLTVNGANTYTWSTGSNSTSIVLTPTASSSFYSVTGTDLNNCVSTASVTVLQAASVNLSISGSNIICSGSSATFTLSGASTYSLNSAPCANIINILPTSNTNYTVTGAFSANCFDTQTLTVYVNTSCADVWPGDANSDGVANNLDILELGLHLTQTGPARASVSNSWQSYFVNSWPGLISNGKNLGHSDCNGDGIINLNDTMAIYNNYNSIHTFKSANAAVTNPEITIIPDQSFVPSGQWGSASVYLGDSTHAVNNINGLAFTVDIMDNFLLVSNQMTVDYPVSFLNPTNQNLNFRKKHFNNGLIYTATTHTNNLNSNGNGKVGVFYFKVDPNITSLYQFNFGISNAYKSDANGIISPLSVSSATSVMVGVPNGVKENGFDNSISIFPNPTKGSVTIKSNTEIKKVEILNVTGQLLLTENVKGNSHQLNLETLAKGIYFVKIYNANGEMAMKKLVTRD